MQCKIKWYRKNVVDKKHLLKKNQDFPSSFSSLLIYYHASLFKTLHQWNQFFFNDITYSFLQFLVSDCINFFLFQKVSVNIKLYNQQQTSLFIKEILPRHSDLRHQWRPCIPTNQLVIRWSFTKVYTKNWLSQRWHTKCYIRRTESRKQPYHDAFLGSKNFN